MSKRCITEAKTNAEHTKTIETIHTQVHINTKITGFVVPSLIFFFFQFKCIHFHTSENLRFFIQFFLAPFCTSIQKNCKKVHSLALRNLFMHIVLWFMVYPPLAPWFMTISFYDRQTFAHTFFYNVLNISTTVLKTHDCLFR